MDREKAAVLSSRDPAQEVTYMAKDRLDGTESTLLLMTLMTIGRSLTRMFARGAARLLV
jgi:hypothetical protein